jgi:hypothetical protein
VQYFINTSIASTVKGAIMSLLTCFITVFKLVKWSERVHKDKRHKLLYINDSENTKLNIPDFLPKTDTEGKEQSVHIREVRDCL